MASLDRPPWDFQALTNMSFGFYSNQKLKEINPPSAKPFRIPSAVRKGASARFLEPLASAEPFRRVFSPHYTICPSAGRVVVFARPALGSQNVSGERTNWGMHDNPIKILIPKLMLSFCFLLVLFPRNMHALSYNNIGAHGSTGSSTNTSTGTRYKQPWQ